MFERERWAFQWFRSRKNPRNICKKIGRDIVTIFFKDGFYTAVYQNRFSRKCYSQDEAKEVAFELVTGEVYRTPLRDPPKKPDQIRKEGAYRTLELKVDATNDEVQSAFRRLIHLHHPDKGGDISKARDLIEARDILTKAS